MYQKKEQSLIKHLDFMILDLLMVELSYLLSCAFRHGWHILFSEQKYMIMAGALALIELLVVLFYNSYQDILRRGYLVELKNILLQNTIVILLVFAFMFLTRQQMYFSRLVFVQFWFFSVVLMYGTRLVWKRVIRKRLRNSEERAHLLVISEAEKLEDMIRQLQKVRYESYKIVGAIAYGQSMRGTVFTGVPVVADWDCMFEYVTREVVDEVFLELDIEESRQKIIIDRFLEMGIAVHINLELSENKLPNALVQTMGNCTVLTTSIKTASMYQMLMKRLMDIAGSLVGVVATGVLFIFLAPIIYIQSPRPIFIQNSRVRRTGLKLRL